ncbi:zf-HC2 domain-containing protein [Georgenia alba]|uniref:Zf-HC2 domain-containing protein n=1 Tax=Georgenia alba TaxID=2233858 RepID=A0ABW2Q4H8_9MICO
MTEQHIPATVLERYAGGRGVLADAGAAAWTVEVHLERCGRCREELARVAPGDLTALVSDVGTRVLHAASSVPQMPARSAWSTHVHRLAGLRRAWIAPAVLPRILMTVLVVAVAVVLDVLDALDGDAYPSLVLLLAPVAPLAGVAAAWSRGLDPAHELVISSPRAGLELVLRRTLMVLLATLPVLAVAGFLVGVAPVRWLLPSLAFTAGSLALGARIGVRRASRWLALAWAGLVIAPGLVLREPSAILEPVFLPAWAALAVVLTAVLAAYGRGFSRPADPRWNR